MTDANKWLNRTIGKLSPLFQSLYASNCAITKYSNSNFQRKCILIKSCWKLSGGDVEIAKYIQLFASGDCNKASKFIKVVLICENYLDGQSSKHHKLLRIFCDTPKAYGKVQLGFCQGNQRDANCSA